MNSGLPFTILIVDDDEDDRTIIDEAFADLGYECNVKKFIHGKALFNYLEQIDENIFPSLIVLDNTLPGMDAMEILEKLKTDPDYKKIPVVVYTTGISPARKQEFLVKGVYACINKGSAASEILAIARQFKEIAEGNKL